MNFEKQKRGVNVLNSKMVLLMNWFSTWDHLSLRAHWVIPGDISGYHGYHEYLAIWLSWSKKEIESNHIVSTTRGTFLKESNNA